jgi:hypothetical protein
LQVIKGHDTVSGSHKILGSLISECRRAAWCETPDQRLRARFWHGTGIKYSYRQRIQGSESHSQMEGFQA